MRAQTSSGSTATALGALIAAGARRHEGGPVTSAPEVTPAPSADPPDPYALPAQVEMRSVAVPGTGVRAGLARADVAAPFEAVTAVVLDFARYRELLPRVDQSRVIQRRRGELDAYFSATMLQGLGTLWARMRFTIARTPGHLRLEGSMVEGNLARFEIRVEVASVATQPGHTSLEVQLLGLPRFFVPEGFLSGVEERWAARGLGAMRDRAVQSARAALSPPAPAPAVLPGPSAAPGP